MENIIHHKKLYISSHTSIIWNIKDANIPISQNIQNALLLFINSFLIL